MKKEKKKKTPPKKEMEALIEEEPLPDKPSERKSAEGRKLFMLILLGAIVVLLAYYFLIYPQTNFVPSPQITAEAFKDVFISGENVYIVMDLRGVAESATRQNIMQCGTDFAGSSGMAGKNMSYFSLSEEGCYTLDGLRNTSECFSRLGNGITIYVHESGSGTTYHPNGMMVGVGPEYAVGTCGISRVG